MLTLFPLYVQARISERRAIKIHDIFKCLNDTGRRLGYGLVLDPCAGCLLCSSFSLAGRKEDLQNRKISHLFRSRRAIYERKLLWTTSCPSIYFSPSRVLSLQIFIMFFPLEFRRASCFDQFFFPSSRFICTTKSQIRAALPSGLARVCGLMEFFFY